MQIKGLAHVNIVVSSIDESLKFYRDILGFQVTFDSVIGSPNFSYGVQLDNVSARVAMLKAANSDTLVELFQYLSPTGEKISPKPANTIPLSHIAFEVSDIFSVYTDLKQKGVQFFTEPQKLGDNVIFCYFRDPDGALLELIEFPVSCQS